MKYNALLVRKFKFEPVKVLTDVEIPDGLTELQRKLFIAPELLEDFDIKLELIKDEKPHGNTKTT
jgi:hypothetical protein